MKRLLRTFLGGLLLATALPVLTPAVPASASAFTVSLSASTLNTAANTGTISLTATTNQTVTGTPYFIVIWEVFSMNHSIGGCGTGTTCTVSTTIPAGESWFVATVAPASASFPPASSQAQSSTIKPWGWTISVSATKTLPGFAMPVYAYTNKDVGPTPYYITIVDSTIGGTVASCGSGTSCSGNAPAQVLPVCHTFTASITGIVSKTTTGCWALL
jgi:hypothetical protein